MRILKWFGLGSSVPTMEPALRVTPVVVKPEVKNRKPKIKVAIDESIGSALAKKIEGRGYQIVTRAGHAETDESWMKRALQSGALFVISPDLDIPSMIERENLPMVWIDFLFAGHINPNLKAEMPKEQKHAIWSQYLHDRIQSKLKFLNKEFRELL
jgi:hypothetical protein